LKENFHSKNTYSQKSESRQEQKREVTFQSVNTIGNEPTIGSISGEAKSISFEEMKREMNKIKNENLREYNKNNRIKILGIDKFEPEIPLVKHSYEARGSGKRINSAKSRDYSTKGYRDTSLHGRCCSRSKKDHAEKSFKCSRDCSSRGEIKDWP
jgi:hypothetical protein